MYAYLIGKVADVTEDNLVVEVGHIGYNVRIPGSVVPLLPPVGGGSEGLYLYQCQGGCFAALRFPDAG